MEKKVKEILEPYGNVASYPRKQQLSHAILDAELKQLQTSSRTLPTIFLLVASAIEFFVCGRMVRSQRQVIGTLKALGYTDREIILHYAGYSLAISLTGTLTGSLLGAFLASLLSQVYAMYFNLPHTIGGLNLKALVAGPALALSIGLAAGVLGSRGVVAVHPARAMRSEAPVQAKPVFLERVKFIWERFDSLWKLSLRRALRYKGRLLLETLGVALAVALLVLSLFFNDCMDYLLKQHFQEDNSYDFLARFSASLRDHEARNLERLPGVIRVEPILEVPIRIRFRGESEDGLLVGLPGELTLKKVRDSDGRRLDPPESGLLLPQGVAAKMGVKPGDRVRVETTLERGKKREVELRVVGVHAEMVGKNSYVSLKEAGTVLGERGIFNAALLKVEPGREPEAEKAMANLDALSSLTSRERDLQGLKKQLGALVLFTGIMIAFSFILGFTMVYSSATVSFSESVREMGVMRVMGFSQAEVAGLLFRETLVRCLGGAVVGLPLGKVLSLAYLKAVGTSDFFSLPAVVYPRTYALAALGGLLFVAAAHWSSARNVKKLELVEVLKAHD